MIFLPYNCCRRALCAQLDHLGAALPAAGDNLAQRARISATRRAGCHTWLIACIYGPCQTISIFRCEPSLKAQAERVATARDETISQVLRRALREYVEPTLNSTRRGLSGRCGGRGDESLASAGRYRRVLDAPPTGAQPNGTTSMFLIESFFYLAAILCVALSAPPALTISPPPPPPPPPPF